MCSYDTTDWSRLIKGQRLPRFPLDFFFLRGSSFCFVL